MLSDTDFTGCVGLVLYSLVFGATLMAFVWSCYKYRSSSIFSVQILFHCFLLSFLCVRWFYVALKTFNGEDTATFILNRVAFCLYFTSFLLVLFYWMETYHKNYIDADSLSGSFLPRLRWVFVLTVVAIYLFQVAIMIVYLIEGDNREKSPIYDANIIADACLFLVYAVLFLGYGMRLLFDRREQAVQLWGDMKEIWKILAVTLIFTACFCCRVVMFLYRPITGKFLNYVVFTFLAYYIAEVVPSLLQVYIVFTSKVKALRDTQFIEDLYAEDSDESNGEDADENDHPSTTENGICNAATSGTALESHSSTAASSNHHHHRHSVMYTTATATATASGHMRLSTESTALLKYNHPRSRTSLY